MSAAQPVPFTLPFWRYVELGYVPIPIQPGSKAPVAIKGWNNPQRTWDYSAYEGHNIGLLCHNIIGLDVDIPNEKHAKQIEALVRKVLSLPRTTPRRVGRAPKCLLVARVNEPVHGWDVRTKSVTLFQLLGQGKQFVVQGTHPDTKQLYTLNRALPAVDRLPLATPEKLAELREALGVALAGLGYEVVAAGTVDSRKGGEGWSGPPWTDTGRQQAQARLDTLDPDMSRPDWIKVGMALADGTCGEAIGFELWDAWSSGGGKYNAREMRKQWNSFRPGGVTRASLFADSLPTRKAEPMLPLRVPETQGGNEPGITGKALRKTRPGAVPWIVSDLMTHGAHLLVGRPKGGKSWATMDMAYAVGNAGQFVGKQARKGRVLWFASEDTRESLARRLNVRDDDLDDNVIVYTAEDLRAERALWDACSFHEMLDARLEADPFDLVIIDTQKTCEAVWAAEKIDERRHASAVDVAYQSVRFYDDIGTRRQACIVLVHHTGKTKNNKGADLHERINMPATVVAGVTGSLVLLDPPDRDLHADDDFQRIFAARGRHMAQGDEQFMVEIKLGRLALLGKYSEVVQSAAQAEIFNAVEALLREKESTTISEIAEMLGKHRNSVQRALQRAAKIPGGLDWKGRRLVVSSGRGIKWQK